MILIRHNLEREGVVNLLAEIPSKCRIADAVLGEQGRHLFERHAILLRDTADGVVDHLIGDLQADHLRALQLDLLENQALQQLLPENIGGRQLDRRVRATGALDDQRRLLSQLALEYDAFVDDGRDAIEEFARVREFGGLRCRCRQDRHGAGSCA